MSLFDRLVDQALSNQGEMASLRPVVEKELLHHDIIREMSAAGLLEGLTFFGGTCLRACYGSNRLSEDLDFAGGRDFKRDSLCKLGLTLVDRLQTRYGLKVEVSDPVRDAGNVDTWKIKVVTRPEQKDLPLQRINIDICAIPSYDSQPMVLRNHYGIEMGTSGLIIQAQSRAEILADKMIALTFRLNRLKNRDLWDIAWLKQQNVELPLALISPKVNDHRHTIVEFTGLLEERLDQLQHDPDLHTDFIREMKRFLPPQIVAETIEQETFWDYLVNAVVAEGEAVLLYLKKSSGSSGFRM